MMYRYPLLSDQEHRTILAALILMERAAKGRGDAMTQMNTGKLHEKLLEKTEVLHGAE